jgi:hypothetical protein
MTKKRAKTFFTTFRGDIINIATIANWMVQQGSTPRSRNEILSCAVRNFTGQIHKLFPEARVTDDADALRLLQELGLEGRKHTAPMLKVSTDVIEKEDLVPVFSPSNQDELGAKARQAQRTQMAEEALQLMEKTLRREKTDKETNKKLIEGISTTGDNGLVVTTKDK